MSSFGYEPPEFLVAAGRLHTFLTRLARHHVRATFDGAMTLHWCPPRQRCVAIASVSPTGFLWTDVAAARLPAPEAAALAHRYVERLAEAWDLDVNRESLGLVWTVCGHDDRLPNLEDLLDKLDVWADAIEELVDALAAR